MHERERAAVMMMCCPRGHMDLSACASSCQTDRCLSHGAAPMFQVLAHSARGRPPASLPSNATSNVHVVSKMSPQLLEASPWNLVQTDMLMSEGNCTLVDDQIRAKVTKLPTDSAVVGVQC